VTSTPREGEYRILRGGEVRWLRSRVFPVHDRAGRVYRVAGVTEDVTKRKRAERELQLYRTFEQLIAELSAEFLKVSEEAMDAACSHALGELAMTIGADGADIGLLENHGATLRVGWRWRRVGLSTRATPEYDLSRAAEYVARLERERVLRIDCIAELPDSLDDVRRCLVRDGYESLVLVALPSQGRLTGVLGFGSARGHPSWPTEMDRLCEIAGTMFANVIERRRAELTLHKHQERLTRVLRFGTAGQLASGIAHELNQPLGAIMSYARGCAQMIARTDVNLDDISRALCQITDQATRAAGVITTLRTLVRFETRREHHDAAAMVDDVVNRVRSECARTGVALDVELGEEPFWVQVDVAQIEHVLLHLVRNALDAVRANAEPRLKLRVQRHDPSSVEFSVADNGHGIDASLTDAVFDEFYTTKPDGLGLGLATSRSIVAAHGGRLWLDRRAAETCFRFTLPLSKPETDGGHGWDDRGRDQT